MPCDKLKVIEDTPATDTTTHNPQSTQEKTNMSSTLVMRRMPEFEIEAYDAASGHYTKVASSQFKGKWTVVCFYPADFTFVCPTEIAAMNANPPKVNIAKVNDVDVVGTGAPGNEWGP